MILGMRILFIFGRLIGGGGGRVRWVKRVWDFFFVF